MSMTRSEVYEVFRQYASAEFKDIPLNDAEINYNFSDKFNKKMQRLFEKVEYNHTHSISKPARNVLIFIAAIIMIFAGLMSVGAVREPIVKFFSKIHEGFSEIFFEGDTINKIEQKFNFSEIPNGFVEAKHISNSGMEIVQFNNTNNGDIVELCQSTTDDYSFFLDSEQGAIDTFWIDGKEIKIFTSNHNDYYFAFWIQDTYSMSLTYSFITDIDTILELIKTIR